MRLQVAPSVGWFSTLDARMHRAVPLPLAVAAWFVVPVGTFGLATWPLLLYAGYRLRSTWLKLAGLAYVAWAATAFGPGRATPGIAIALLLVGGVHSAVVGRLVWRAARDSSAVGPPPAGGTASVDGAASAGGAASTGGTASVAAMVEAVAAERRASERRRRAREILRAQPSLGRELRIGRPDLARTYNDGGLVDINRVPADVLVTALEIPRETADRIVAERELRSGLDGPDDLLVHCGLSIDRLAAIRDRLVFPPG